MLWKDILLSVEGCTADGAYRSQNQAMRSEELSAELRDGFIARQSSGERYKKCGLHNSRMKEFWHNRDSSKSCLPGKTEQWREKVTKNLMVTLTELQEDNQPDLYGKEVKRQPLFRANTCTLAGGFSKVQRYETCSKALRTSDIRPRFPFQHDTHLRDNFDFNPNNRLC